MRPFTTMAAGMACARLSRLLPALALLLGALLLFPAAPAWAQTVIQPPTNLAATPGAAAVLVSNVGESVFPFAYPRALSGPR